MHYKEKYINDFIQYLNDICSQKEESLRLISGIEKHLNKLKDEVDVSFDYEKYSDVASYCSLIINKNDNKIEEYFASGDDLTLSVSKDKKYEKHMI